MITTTITAKGQVTIPKEIRQALKLKAGDRVSFVIEEDRAILVPSRRLSLMELRGVFSTNIPYTSYETAYQEAGYQRGQALAEEIQDDESLR